MNNSYAYLDVTWVPLNTYGDEGGRGEKGLRIKKTAPQPLVILITKEGDCSYSTYPRDLVTLLQVADSSGSTLSL